MPAEPDYFGVFDSADADWMRRRLTPMAASLVESSVVLQHPVANGVPATFVRCVEPAMRAMDVSEQQARMHGWSMRTLATGHNAMMSAPSDVAELLLSLTQ